MSYGVCNCVSPPPHGLCGGCGIDFGPGPAPTPYAPWPNIRPPAQLPLPAPIENHYHYGPTIDEIRKVIREEIERANATQKDKG